MYIIVIPGVQFSEAQTFAVQPEEMLYCFWRLLDANISPESTDREKGLGRAPLSNCLFLPWKSDAVCY